MIQLAIDVLRETPRRASGSRAGGLIGIIIGCGFFCGMIAGSSGDVVGRPLQMFYTAIKVPMLLLVVFGLNLPSFFVINTLLDLREDFGEVLRALLAAGAALAIVLASLSPLTLLWYVSTNHHEMHILFNAAEFAVATIAAHAVLRRAYRPLIARKRIHARLLAAWLIGYAFVGIQLAWVLRPFIGDPGRPTQFFRADAWGNAYVEFVRLALRAI